MSDNQITAPDEIKALYLNIRGMIESARTLVVSQVNQILVITYWRIGKTIKNEILNNNRADYGSFILKKLAEQLSIEFGSGFSYSNLTRMAKLYSILPEEEIVVTLSQQLSWSHFVEIIKIEDKIKFSFYIQMCVDGRWSVRTLRERIDSMLFERTAISKKPDILIAMELEKMKLQPHNVNPSIYLKDPYLLDFLDLKDNFSELDLEKAILSELERFLLELGTDFAFMSRQKRIQIGGNDYYLDLLFYHRKLKRLVLIELKLGDFKPEYKGQVELYLKWLAKNEQQDGENSPIAIILCSGKDLDVVELFDLEPENIHIGEYWLKLPTKETLQEKLHKAMKEARDRLELQEAAKEKVNNELRFSNGGIFK